MLSLTVPPRPEAMISSQPRILESRSQYRPCHIRLPGEDQRTAAILVNGKYYSLVKVVKSRQQAVEIHNRLTLKGNEALITPIAKGEAIWAFEPDAIADTPSVSGRTVAQTASPSCRILGNQTPVKFCQIYLPDLNDQLEAILVDGKYYGLFKVAETRQQALEFAAKLGRRGDETIISKTSGGEAVWVLEPDARPV